MGRAANEELGPALPPGGCPDAPKAVEVVRLAMARSHLDVLDAAAWVADGSAGCPSVPVMRPSSDSKTAECPESGM